MAKSDIILRTEDLEEKVSVAVEKIAGIVKRTLGPGGLPILLEREGQTASGLPLPPMITKDGVTVAKHCYSNDKVEDLVIQSLKDICGKTDRSVGDGTTTAIVLGEAIFTEALKLVKEKKLNPQTLRKEIEVASEKVIKELQKYKIEVGNNIKLIRDVATVSANGDKEIGDLVAKAFDKVGAEGTVTVDEGYSRKSTIEIVDGFQIGRGVEGGDLFLNNSANDKFLAENCHVLLYDGTLQSVPDELLPVLNVIQETTFKKALKENPDTNIEKVPMPPVLFIANDFSPSVVQYLSIIKQQTSVPVCAVRSPHMTTVRTQMLDDMAFLLGGERLGFQSRSLKSVTEADIGFVKKVEAGRRVTTFYGGEGHEEEIIKRIDVLKGQLKGAVHLYDQNLLRDRISNLAQGVAKIAVGGDTDFEIKEKYYRIEDALSAAKAAIEGGVVLGGGSTLVRISYSLKEVKNDTDGYRVIKNSILEPFNQICKNIGWEAGDYDSVAEFISENGKAVFDAQSRSVTPGLENGIVDPIKVIENALRNAVSICGLLSTFGGLVLLKEKKEQLNLPGM